MNNKSLFKNESIKEIKKNLFSSIMNQSSANKINKKLYSTLNLNNIEKEISNFMNDKEEKKVINSIVKIKNRINYEKINFKRANTLKKDYPKNKYFLCREDNYNYNEVKNKYLGNENKKEYLTLLNDRDKIKDYKIKEINNNKLLIYPKQITNRNSNYYYLNRKKDLMNFDFDTLKFENKLLKEKIYIFLKLIRNYSKKLNFLSKIIIKLKKITKENNIYKELILTINNLNKLINNPILKENIFKIKRITREQNIEKQNKLIHKTTINKIILEEKKTNLLIKNPLYSIKNNDNYKNLLIEKTNAFNFILSPIKIKGNFNKITNNELNNVKIENSFFNNNNDNNNSINKSPKFSVNLRDDVVNNLYSLNFSLIIKDFNNKIKLLEKENKSLNEKINKQISNYNIIFNKANNLEIENKSLKLKLDNQKENLETQKLLEMQDKIIIFQNELKNKNNIINYLENLLKRINNNFSEINKYNKYKENNFRNNKINLRDMDAREDNNKIFMKYKKCNSCKNRENKNNMNKIKNISNIEENEIEKNQNEISDISNLKEILNILDFPHFNDGININLNRNNKKYFNNISERNNKNNNYERNNQNYMEYKYNKSNKDKDKDKYNLNNLNEDRMNRAFSLNNEKQKEKNEEINFYIKEHNQINKEINYLDEEIFQLQFKLNQLLKE